MLPTSSVPFFCFGSAIAFNVCTCIHKQSLVKHADEVLMTRMIISSSDRVILSLSHGISYTQSIKWQDLPVRANFLFPPPASSIWSLKEKETSLNINTFNKGAKHFAHNETMYRCIHMQWAKLAFCSCIYKILSQLGKKQRFWFWFYLNINFFKENKIQHIFSAILWVIALWSTSQT